MRDEQSPLGIARGAVREGLAALEVFGDLLGSRRVGPRALERARSDTAEACVALAEALRTLDHIFYVSFSTDDAAQACARPLCEHAIARVKNTLSTALSAPEPLENARRRLALEAAIRKHGAELRDAMILCNLLAAAAAPAPTEIDLVELLQQRFGSKNDAVSAMKLGIEAPRPTLLVVDTYVLGGLVEIATSLVARSGAASARLGVFRDRTGVLSVRISATPRTAAPLKTTVLVPLRSDVPGVLGVARATARRTGLEFTVDPATGTVSITSEVRAGAC